MGAGDFPAGSDFAGFDPVQTGTNPRIVTPDALHYDGSSRDWLLEADGNYKNAHWVDQSFVLGTCTRKGAIKSNPEIGNTLHEIPYLGGVDLEAAITDRVRKSTPIKTLLDNGDATIIRIAHESMPGGGLKVAVYYRNLRSEPQRVRRTTVSF